jgi:ATP-dependent Clp protease protease subunit
MSDFKEVSNYIWVHKFTDESLKHFYEQFLELEANPDIPVIVIVVSSYGGDITSAFAMRDLIKSSSKPVATIALGKAMSAGAVLLAAGTQGLRFASPDALILVHEVSSGAYGKSTEVKASAESLNFVNKLMFKNLAEDCGKTVKEFEEKLRSLKNADWTLTAKEAFEWGLIDDIAIPRLLPESNLRLVQLPKPKIRYPTLKNSKDKR